MMSELVLHEAAANGAYQDLQPMLMMGRIDPSFKDEDFGDRTPLHWAASRVWSKMSLNVNGGHDLLLHEVCAMGDYSKLEELGHFVRKSKMDVNIRDEEWSNKTALHWAATKGHARCVKLLLEYGADPSAKMVGGWTPAHCAAETGKFNVLKVLVDYHAPVALPDDSGDTPKRVAEIYGHTACIELLLSAEDSESQKKHALKDKLRSNVRKVSRMVQNQPDKQTVLAE